MTLRSKFCAASMLTLALVATGCGSDDDDNPLPIPDPIVAVEENFEGTLNPLSARTHLFQVEDPGDVILQLTAIDPAGTVVGMSIGTSNGIQCQAAVSTEAAALNTAILAVARSVGTLCARIYDSSETGLPGPVTYTLEVTHY